MKVIDRKTEPTYIIELPEREAKVLAVILSRFSGDRRAIEGWPSSVPLVEELWPTYNYSDPEWVSLLREISNPEYNISFSLARTDY